MILVADHPRPEGRAPAHLRGRAPRRLRARARRRPHPRPRRADRPRQEEEAHHRDRRRPPRHRGRRGRGQRIEREPARGQRRAGAEARRRHRARRHREPAQARSRPNEERMYSEYYACAFDGTNVGELAPRNFSFNSPHGACSDCTGLGVKMEIDPALVIPDRNVSDRGRRDRAVVAQRRDEHLVLPHAAGGGEEARLQAQRARERDEAEGPRPRAVRRRGQDLRRLHQLVGGHTNSWDTTFEGVIPNLSRRYQRDRLRVHPRRDREVHGGRALQRPARARG